MNNATTPHEPASPIETEIDAVANFRAFAADMVRAQSEILRAPRDFHTMTYAEACEPGSGFSHSEPVNTVCGVCGMKHCGCTHDARDRRADLGSKVGR